MSRASSRSSPRTSTSNYYGNGSYGVLGRGDVAISALTDLDQLTLGQVALLAALPQSPSCYDLVRNAVTAADGTLYVPLDAGLPIVDRRNYILDLLAPVIPRAWSLTGDQYTRRRFRGGQERADHPRAPGVRSNSSSGWRRTSSGRCATSWPRSCAPAPRPARRSSAAGCASSARSTANMQQIGREVGHRGRAPAPPDGSGGICRADSACPTRAG